jgi:hypothetical protein
MHIEVELNYGRNDDLIGAHAVYFVASLKLVLNWHRLCQVGIASQLTAAHKRPPVVRPA